MFCRILPAFLHPVYFSVAFSAAASSVPKEQSAKAVSRVFTGLTVGMVLGIPITSLLGNQLKILVKPQLWFNIAATCFILAALYSVYSYFAEYLRIVTNMNGKTISIMLILFGASGVFGNLQAAKLLSKSVVKTTIFYPLLLGIIYLLVFSVGNYTIPMILIIIAWGAVFTSGLIISQTWLTLRPQRLARFGNSLFVSFANLGITIGTASGGWFLSQMGTHQIVWSGILFLMLAFICIGVKIKLFDLKEVKV
ncbi:UNVERIFIED_CONTAM: DHA1 family inner membrane transport protein [Paenibacillus sp. PvR008]